MINTQEKIKKVEELIKDYKSLSDYWDKLSEVLGADICMGLGNLNWKIFDKLTDSVSREIGDDDSWVSWWLFDNLLGRNGLAVKVNGKSRKIGNVKQLVKLIEDLNRED